MVTINDVVLDAADRPVPNASILIDLMVGPKVGGVGFLPGQTIANVAELTADANGAWTVNLAPNSTIEPVGTVYRITYAVGHDAHYTIIVPATGGPYHVRDLLASVPATGPAPVIAARNVTYDNSQSGLAATNVQDAIDQGGGGGGGGGAITLSGDVSGHPTTTSVDKIKGIPIAGTRGAGKGLVDDGTNLAFTDVATQAELDAEASTRASADTANASAVTSEAATRAAADTAEATARAAAVSAEASARAAADALLVPLTQKGTVSGVASLDSGGRVPAAQLPSLVLSHTYVVGSQAAMLALSQANTGDLAVRTDVNETFILSGADPTQLSNWTQLLFPGGGAVSSVNTRTGAVTGLAEASDLTAETARAETAEALAAQKSSNLSDLANAGTARANLGLGSAATHPATDFDAAGAASTEQTRAQAAEATLTTSVAARMLGLTRTAVKTANYTATSGDLVPCDSTSGAFTVTLPTAANGAIVAVKHVTQGSANAITVACAGADVFNKTAGAATLTLSLLAQGVVLVGAAGIWTIVADDLALAQLDLRYEALLADPIPVAKGGTGAADAAAAKINLGLASVFGNFGAFTSFGHSYTQRGGTPEPFSGVLLGNGEIDQFTNFVNRLTAALHIWQVAAWGRSGAAITSPSDASDGAPMGLGALFRYCYPSHWFTAAQKAFQSSRARPGLNLLEFTFNDHYRDPTASIDGVQVGATFKQAMRAAIARMRLAWLVASDNTGQASSVAFAGSGAWTPTANAFLTKGTSQVNPTNGATFTITLPSDMLGPVYVDVFLHANRNLYYRLPIAINSTQTRIPVAANYIGYPTGANSLLVNDEVAIGAEDMLVTALSETTDLTRSVTTSNSSVTVTCATAAANDVNKIITGGNIQAGTWISSVTVGVSYTLSQATSGSGASTFTASLTHSATVTRGHNGSSAASALINAGVGLSTRTGKVTWSGTCTGTLAGTATTVNGGTGTTILAGQGCANQRIQIVQRFLCSAADAGKTIIGTVSGLAANEDCTFDSWGIEDPGQPPVLVLNQPEFHGGNIGTTHEGSYTTQYRTAIAALCGAGGEFDANVVLVDLWTTFRQQTKMTLSTAIAATGTTTVIVTPFDATNCVVQVGSRIRTWGTLAAVVTYEDMYVTAVDKTNGGANDGKWKLTVTRAANGTTACDTISLNQTIYEGRYIRQDDYVHPTDAGHELITSLCLTGAASLTQTTLQIAGAGGLSSKVKPRIRDSYYYNLNRGLLRTAGTSTVKDTATYYPFEVTEECVLLKMGAEVVAGGASTTIRFMVYDDGDRPGNLVYDLGTVATTGTGNAEIACFVPLKPGFYWFGFVTNGGTTQPTLRAWSTANVVPPPYPIGRSVAPPTGTADNSAFAISITGQTGAAADPCPTTGETIVTSGACHMIYAQFGVLERD